MVELIEGVFFFGDLVIIGLYVLFNILLWRATKDKRLKRLNEVILRGVIPATITGLWIWLVQSYLIAFLNPACWILVYCFNFSELFLSEHFSTTGERLVIISLYNEEPEYNTVNIYLDTSRKSQDVRKTFEENISKLSKEERQEYEKLVAGLVDFEIKELYLVWLDFLKDDWVRYLKVYCLYISEEETIEEKVNVKTREKTVLKVRERIIPKVLHLNSVRLRDEEIHGKDFSVICGVEGPRDDKLLLGMAKLCDAMENVKGFPKWWEFRLLQERYETLEATNEKVWEELQELKKYKKRYKARFRKLEEEN